MSLRNSVLPGLSSLAASAEPTSDAPISDASQASASADDQAALPAPPILPGVLLSKTALASEADLAGSFSPTEPQVRCKARFWQRMGAFPPAGPMTLALAQHLTGSGYLASWWQRPGFKEWFLSADSVNEKLEWLYHLALKSAEQILSSDDPKGAAARVAMVRAVAELAGKMNKGPDTSAGKTEARKKAIESMSREEIVKLLDASGIRVEQVVSLPATASTPNK